MFAGHLRTRDNSQLLLCGKLQDLFSGGLTSLIACIRSIPSPTIWQHTLCHDTSFTVSGVLGLRPHSAWQVGENTCRAPLCCEVCSVKNMGLGVRPLEAAACPRGEKPLDTGIIGQREAGAGCRQRSLAEVSGLQTMQEDTTMEMSALDPHGHVGADAARITLASPMQ
jgi:hypothetical protein